MSDDFRRRIIMEPDIVVGPLDSAVVWRQDGTLEGCIPEFCVNEEIGLGSPSFWACVVLAMFSEEPPWPAAREAIANKFLEVQASLSDEEPPADDEPPESEETPDGQS